MNALQRCCRRGSVYQRSAGGQSTESYFALRRSPPYYIARIMKRNTVIAAHRKTTPATINRRHDLIFVFGAKRFPLSIEYLSGSHRAVALVSFRRGIDSSNGYSVPVPASECHTRCLSTLIIFSKERNLNSFSWGLFLTFSFFY